MSTVKTNEKWRAVETALTQIERQFGKGSIMRLGERPETAIAVIPTGSLAVDAALGVGGIPRGRVVEIFGPESLGKTTLSLQVIAKAQKTGGVAAFIDAEHALDAEYAKKLGRRHRTTSWSASPTTARRPSRSPRCWSGPAPSTSSSSTRSRRWCPRPRSRARSATRTSASRPA